MRELIFKNLNTPTSRKRDISLEEIVERDGFVSSTRKRSIYFVLAAHRITSKEELEKWVNIRKKDPALNRKFFHILRKFSDKEKQDTLMCKMRGSFYLMSDDSVYHVVFVHTLRAKIHKQGELKCT